MNCLYKEHLQGNKVCQIGKRLNTNTNSTKQETESELIKYSGLVSLSDLTEEIVKVTVKKNNFGPFKVKGKPNKRKAEVDEAHDDLPVKILQTTYKI